VDEQGVEDDQKEEGKRMVCWMRVGACSIYRREEVLWVPVGVDVDEGAPGCEGAS
jgi:hypothetical protein